jgi:hypothetical protein
MPFPSCQRLSVFARGLALLCLLAPPAVQAQGCPCGCAQPTVGQIGPDGACQCPCEAVPIPGINAETLSGPPKPPMAGGPPPTWTVEPAFDDGFGGPFWDDWW